ncbi:TraX family protein [Salinicola sp. JS01]|uniref:TraX family protein n=1 Tax=Salinicola sp. JS01 TaxID=3050071 RepID=UPI00255C1304|nr:TraX family protein [Salinicola sp. JS01]WIX31605.1 TraX family protein [Salinicola sp. JS01]
MTRTNAWVPLAQWLAILAMTQEHAIKFIWPDSPAVPWAILVGRIVFPLFAGMVAWHLLHNTRRPLRYGCRLLLVGLVAQLPYALVVTPDKLNVCFTLGLGLLAVVLLVRLEERTLQLAAGLTLLMLALAAHPWIEYGLPGLLLVPAFALAFRYPRHTAAALPLLFAAILINAIPARMVVSLATAVVLLLLANGSLSWRIPVPAIPRPLRLSWYPLHLLVITLVTAGITS